MTHADKKYQNLSDADLEFLISEHEPQGTDVVTFWALVAEKERRKKLQIELALAPHRNSGNAHVFDPQSTRFFSAQACKPNKPTAGKVDVELCDEFGTSAGLQIHPEEAFALAMILIRAGLQARAHRDQPRATALVANTIEMETAA